MPEPIYLDNTKLQCFCTCERKFYWRHIRHLVKKGEGHPALTLGKAIHSALEVIYKGGDEVEATKAFLSEYPPTPSTLEEDKRGVENGLLILKGYLDKFIPERDWKIVRVEVPGMFELTSDILFAWKADLVVETMGGLYGVEHKTSSNARWFVPKPNHQISGYIYGSKVQGYPLDGFIVNLIMVFKTKRDYKRLITTRTPEMLEEWRQWVIYKKHQIDNCLENNWFPLSTNSCWNCPYTDLCSINYKHQEALISSTYEVSVWAPWEQDNSKKEEEGRR